MKLIIEIPEGTYKHVDIIQNGSIGAKQIINSVKNGVPAYKAELFKGMTNGEVLEEVFGSEFYPPLVFCADWYKELYSIK